MGNDDKISELMDIEHLPLSGRAVDFLKSRNIQAIKDLRNFNAEDCQKIDNNLAGEISEIIAPYLEEIGKGDPVISGIIQWSGSSDMAEKSADNSAGKVYSNFLKESLSREEINRASRISIHSLDVARFKVLIASFKKWGVKTVADILKIKPKRISKIRGVGATKISLLTVVIREAVFGENKPDEKLFLATPEPDLLLGRYLSEQEKKLLADIAVENVVDDARARTTFRKLRIKTVCSAACVTREKFLSTSGAGRKTVEKVIKSIEEIIKGLACIDYDIQINEEGIKQVIDEHVLAPLSDEQKMLLRDRYGLWDGASETLEDVGHKLNKSRQRVLQIQGKAENSLRRMLIPRLFATWLMDRFKAVAHEALRKDYEGLASLSDLENIVFNIDKDVLAADLAYKMLRDIYYPRNNSLAEGLLQCDDNVVALDNNVRQKFEKVSSALELALVSKGKPQFSEDLAPAISKTISANISPMFLKRCAELCSKIGLDTVGKIGLKRWPHFKAQNMEYMAKMALLELGSPSHYSYITQKMNVMFPHRAPFSERSVHSRMSNHPEIFVWAGRRGTYALADWGIKQYPFIKDFLAEELRSADCPLSEDELVSRGVAKYGYKPSSIRMTISFQKRLLKKLPDGMYVLNH